MTNNYLQLTSLVVMQVKRSIIIKPVINNHGNWTEWSAIWSEIIRLILKSHVWFEITSTGMISDQFAQHRVQLPFYYSHFEIAEFSQYQYLFEQVAVLLKSRNKKAFKSHFVPETELIEQTLVQKIEQKLVRFKTEMMWFRTWMMQFREEVI